MTDIVVSLSHVSKQFQGPPPVQVIRDASLTVEKGEHVVVMGPSGSGKSTLMNVIGLLDGLSSGTYELDGVDVSALTERRRTALRRDMIGFVFQDFYLMPGRTAWENVALSMVYTGCPAKQRLKKARLALEKVGLSHREDALPTTMSGGERQRVAIARALVHDPTLLLCDEPTGNLDSHTTRQVMELIAEVNRAGVTVITITHDPATAAWGSRRFTIRDGEVSVD